MRLDDCMQEKCSHCPLNQNIQGELRDLILNMCPVCAKCGAPKHKINQDCSECIKCENGEGYLRGNAPKGLQSEWVKNKVKQDLIFQEDTPRKTEIIITERSDR